MADVDYTVRIVDDEGDADWKVALDGDQVVDADTLVQKAGDTMTGELIVPDLSVSGLTGAVAPSRYVGRVSGAAPVSGTFAVGDWVVDVATAQIWVCTVAGSPGTWLYSGSKELAYQESTSNYASQAGNNDVTGLSISFTAGVRPFAVEIHVPALKCTAGAGTGMSVLITDGSNATQVQGIHTASTVNTWESYTLKRRFAASAGAKTYKARQNGANYLFDALAGAAPYYIQAYEL